MLLFSPTPHCSEGSKQKKFGLVTFVMQLNFYEGALPFELAYKYSYYLISKLRIEAHKINDSITKK
jgi:hypothetical protein